MNREGRAYLVDAARGKHGQGDVSLPARVRQRHRAHHIHTICHEDCRQLPHHILLVELAPVHIGSSRLVITHMQ